MVDLAYVTSTVLMGALVVAIVAATLRFGAWRRYSPAAAPDEGRSLGALADRPAVWIGAFGLLALGFGGGAVLYVSGGLAAGTAIAVLAAVGAVALVGYLFVGMYTTARSRGRPASWAVAEGTAAVGFLLVAAITIKLVVG